MLNEPFAKHGFEKMIYDLRMGPQGVSYKENIFIVYHGNPFGQMPHPHIIKYNIAKDKWCKPVKIANASIEGWQQYRHPFGPINHNKLYDHHFCPVVWIDSGGYIHVLYRCHIVDGGIHMISREPESISSWKQGPQIYNSISYPKIEFLPEGKLLLYYRVFGHMGYWAYQLSSDGGYSWDQPVKLFDFDANPAEDRDCWAGSYHSVKKSPDGGSLHIGFTYWDESKTENPRYKKTVGTRNRYNLYYARLDIPTRTLYNIEGTPLKTPVNKTEADAFCTIWNTGDKLTNMPAIATDSMDQPLLLLPASEDAPDHCCYYFFRRDQGQWKGTTVTETNDVWSGCLVRQEDDGGLTAYLIVGKKDSKTIAYGGGMGEVWYSGDDGVSWKREQKIMPEPGLLYNNPRFVVDKETGNDCDGYLLFYGWEGPDAIQPVSETSPDFVNRGRAYLHEV